MGHFFLYLFLQITFLARCHYPSGPRVTSLVAIRNQPRFLKLQKEWDRKGGGRRSEAEKVAAEGVGQKKVVAAKIVGKANPKNERRFCQEEEERQKRKK